MDSPIRQASPNHLRTRTDSSFSVQSTSLYPGIRKRSSSPSHFSAAQTARIQQAFQPFSTSDFAPNSLVSAGLQWITPQQSPQPHLFPDTTVAESLSQWTVPTPPRSDSGLPPLSIDANKDSGVVPTQDNDFGQSSNNVEMSSLGFLLPSQYGSSLYESESNNVGAEHSFPPMRSAPSSGPPAFSQTISSSPALYQSRPAPASSRRPDAPSNGSNDSTYGSGYRRISSPYGSTPGSEYSMGSSQTIPPISGLTQGSLSSPPIGHSPSGMMGQYNQSIPRSHSLYDSSMYSQPPTSAPPASQLYASNYGSPMMGSGASDMMPKPMAGGDAAMRVLNQRPKPQCWEHGCNGRQFSTFSNLLRHQREKSGTASKSYCPRCGAEFTRTTARNGHLQHDKCTKTRRDSEEK
ncbi:hypothetical protein Q7P37_007276 [Cladosporium fusiforme]